MMFIMHCVIVSKTVITGKQSQWASPIVCVPEKNGEIRLCVDLKVTLNKYVSVDQYPSPKSQDLFKKFHERGVFCRIDLSNSYLQLEVDESSRNLLTINYLWVSVIDKILEGIKYCDAYTYDIGGKDDNSCKSVLYAVLSLLNDYNSLEMLSYVLNADGLPPCKSKIDKLINTKSPQNVTQLESYLGLYNYYHKFIKTAPDVMEPKSVISVKSLLVIFDPKKPIILTSGSSSYGVGAVLSQPRNGIEKPVVFESATLNNAQKNYSQLRREALSIIYGVTKFHKYLVGNRLTISH
ncbi:hypothetical protein PR048_024842 [Dryococelus australis]|uniref:Reverse transcriptase/retrotransposon-derived protein RNase H-like domain-containing protein n=1 Tax=Dryococelus australis TaxID=614101 RepID=A0ABQ9GPP2_9NEOP|nr:hypothetical protein PR048_024842 [Dryococelus australis]